MMISLAWGVVAARIFKGDEDLATLRCSLAQQRSVTERISHGQGDLVTLRCSLNQQRSLAARILHGQGDLATLQIDRCSCSSSMATTLGLLRGRMEERKEIDEMTTMPSYCGTGARATHRRAYFYPLTESLMQTTFNLV